MHSYIPKNLLASLLIFLAFMLPDTVMARCNVLLKNTCVAERSAELDQICLSPNATLETNPKKKSYYVFRFTRPVLFTPSLSQGGQHVDYVTAKPTYSFSCPTEQVWKLEFAAMSKISVYTCHLGVQDANNIFVTYKTSQRIESYKQRFGDLVFGLQQTGVRSANSKIDVSRLAKGELVAFADDAASAYCRLGYLEIEHICAVERANCRLDNIEAILGAGVEGAIEVQSTITE